MADIDFITDLTNGFDVSLGDNPRSVKGNRALLNRFEITLMTSRRQMVYDDKTIIDDFGGDAQKFINQTRVLSDTQGIAAAVDRSVTQTVLSMKRDEPAGLPDTEKIESAEILSIDIVQGVITAKIRVMPVEVESYDLIEFNLPIVRS